MLFAQSWFIAALLAAVLWGLAYTFSERLLKTGISPAFLMLSIEALTLPIILAIVLKSGNLQEQISILFSNKAAIFMCVFMAFAIIGGNLLILYSMSEKNATITSLIEISYPLFVFIFSWIIFREIQINWQQAIGGLLIFIGVVVIYIKS